MTHYLREALRDLADHTDRAGGGGGSATPEDLWRRGRRARRRKNVSSVGVAVAVLALAGALAPLAGEQLRTTPGPASYDPAELAVPDRIWSPSDWAPGAGGDSPPGPLALVAVASRRGPWLVSESEELFGVSAVDQRYRWLELPRRAQTEQAQAVALSPDGTKLAYLVGGEPTAEEVVSDVVGFAVLDLVTGEATERVIKTRFGVHNETLVWSGDSDWLFTAPGQYREPVGEGLVGWRSPGGFEAWNPETGAVTEVVGLDDEEAMATAPTGVATWKNERLVDIDPASGQTVDHAVDWWWRDDAMSDAPVFNTDRSHVAWRDGRPKNGGTFPAVYVAPVPAVGAPGRPRLLNVPGLPDQVLGWRDRTTVLVQTGRYRNRLATEPTWRILGVDVESGEVTPAIGRPESYDDLHDLQFASNLLDRPLVEGDRPGRHVPLGPTAVAGLMLAAVALFRRARRRARA
jgi:hypothetical protein